MTTTTLSVLFSLSTAVVVGSFTLFVRSGQRHANAVSGVLIGIIVSFPPLLVVAIWTWEPTHYQPLAWFFFALAGVMGPAVGRVCFFHSIHLIGVARAVPLNSTMPLFSAIIGILILGERPGPFILAGTVLIVLGCVGITSKRGEPQSIRKEYLLVALGSVVFFSISHMLRKLGVGPAPNPFVGISIMSVSGGISLYVFGQYLPPGLRPSLVVKKAWVTYSIGGSLNALSVLLHLYGLRYGDLTIVIPLSATAPLWALLLTAIFLRKIERITWPILLGTLAVVVGGALVAGRAL